MTNKMYRCIKHIEETLGITYTGENRQDALDFIGKYKAESELSAINNLEKEIKESKSGFYIYDKVYEDFMDYEGYGTDLADAYLFSSEAEAQEWIDECDNPSKFEIMQATINYKIKNLNK